jgi:predicted dehydrogenase
MPDVKFMTLDPGHFHAALVHKKMTPGVDRRVAIYAPLGPDLVGHLNRLIGFNTRKDDPTAWEAEVRAVPAGVDPLARLLEERPGNVVMLSGRNDVKIDRIKAAVEAGLNVLSDKPWVIEAENLPKLESALATAQAKGLVAFDMMTERYEVTSQLLRELAADPEVFGRIVPGDEKTPGLTMTSTHYLMKLVAGVPNRRPAWYFDTRVQGEGLSDVGTHLVDLSFWTLFPETPIAVSDITLHTAERRPTKVSRADFAKVTGEADFPASVAGSVRDGVLDYYCNTYVDYSVRGVRVRVAALWDFEQPVNEGDTAEYAYNGTLARLEMRQSKATGFKPEIFIIPHAGPKAAAVLDAAAKRIAAVQSRYPGVALSTKPAAAGGTEAHVAIPDKYRVGHEAHFASVVEAFLGYLKNPASMPAWERPNMIAKYFVTTGGVKLSRGR